jgi:hypothetical protein
MNDEVTRSDEDSNQVPIGDTIKYVGQEHDMVDDEWDIPDTSDSGTSRRDALKNIFFYGSGGATVLVTSALMVHHAKYRNRPYWKKGFIDDVIVKGDETLYPYNVSTFEAFTDLNKRVFYNESQQQRDVDTVATIANNIANGVAHNCLRGVQESLRREGKDNEALSLTMKQTMAYLAQTKEGQIYYAKMIAHELMRAQCEYDETEAFNQSVTDLMGADKVRMDCDLLSHIALHCASRHDMPFIAYAAPQHMYVGSTTIPDLAFEMTLFRNKTGVNGWGKGIYGTEIADGFITSHSAKLEQGAFGRSWNDYPEECTKYGYFHPVSGKDIESYIALGVYNAKFELSRFWGKKNTIVSLAEWSEGLAKRYEGNPGGLIQAMAAYSYYNYLAQICTKQGKQKESETFRMKANQYSSVYKEHKEFIDMVRGTRVRLIPIRIREEIE